VALVVYNVRYPSVLSGQQNGKLSSSILVSTPGLSGGPTIRLVSTASRCWAALTDAALKDGIVLQATSSVDSYRPYQWQVNTFVARYTPEPTGNTYKWWDSDGSGTPERWYKKDNVATAAVPGTSNHGWGIAVDVAYAKGARLAWLEAYAPKFGWCWETVPEEAWHIRNFTGDNIPRAVLDYEEGLDMPTAQEIAKAVAEYVYQNASRGFPNPNGFRMAETDQGTNVQVFKNSDALVALQGQLDAIQEQLNRIEASGGAGGLVQHTHGGVSVTVSGSGSGSTGPAVETKQ
jgi:hypothetical protein